jgi:hypothetical protein
MELVDFSYAALGVLLAGFVPAAYLDVRDREVDDRLWLAVALLGGGLQAVVIGSGGALPLALWLVVLAFVIQHLVPWDEAFGEERQGIAAAIELATYIGVGALLFGLAYREGVGSSSVPAAVLAAYVSVLLARALFEANLLYGGADAKAVMVVGAAVPFLTTVLVAPHGSAAGVLSFYPFALTVLMNGALASVVIPIALFVRNARMKAWNGLRTFTSYPLDVEKLPDRYVWVTDPTFRRDDDAETSDDDRKIRERIRDELRAQGVRMVWVTPQVPFVVLLLLGVVLGMLFGNVLADGFAYL